MRVDASGGVGGAIDDAFDAADLSLASSSYDLYQKRTSAVGLLGAELPMAGRDERSTTVQFEMKYGSAPDHSIDSIEGGGGAAAAAGDAEVEDVKVRSTSETRRRRFSTVSFKSAIEESFRDESLVLR